MLLLVERDRSLDIARGAVMVLMAIDHVRVYAGVPAGGPDPAVFLTRWVTHVCAPAFVFFAGTAAYLYGQKEPSRAALAKFLLVRGMWLVLLELTVLRFAWTFNFDYLRFTFAGVIWVTGWSMVILAALVFLRTGIVAAIGVLVIILHNAFAPLVGQEPSAPLRILYAGGVFRAGPLHVAVLYTLVPWFAVMAAGYGFGAVMNRRRAVFALGVLATLCFVVLRVTGVYGDPRVWEGGWQQFLSPAKYPASLQFLLMTLGPVLAVLPFLATAPGRVARWLQVFGRVPFFYYLLHIPLIHLIAVLISLVRTPAHTAWLFANHPMMPPEVPPQYEWPLALLYLVTAVAVVALYFPCRSYARVKAERRRPWMKYI